MSTEKKIIVRVDKKGGTKIEAQGFADNTCLKATASLEEALGVVKEKDLKQEAYVEPLGNKVNVGS
jgi:hypothetical protein